MRKTILQLMVVALVLAIFPTGVFASVWEADDISIRADHVSGPYDPDYDPEAYWDYYLKALLEQINMNNNPGVNITLDYLNCSEIVAMLTNVTSEVAAKLCSADPAERKEGMLSYWGLAGLGGNFFGFMATLADASRSAADATITFQTAPFITEDVGGYTPADLALYKLFNDGGKLPFVGYSTSGAGANADGYWCLMTYGSGGLGNPVSINQVLNETGAYMIRYWIKNNGSYDQDPTDGTVLDPVTLAFKAAGEDDGDGGGGGCVLNAVAGLSLEWLLILLAPAVLIFRRRK